MRRSMCALLALVFLAALAGAVAGQTSEENGFVVDDLELISMRSRPDWGGDWTGPIEAATVLAWFHDHGFPALLTDLNGDGVVDELDTIEQADRFGKGLMNTAELGLTPDALLVHALATHVAAAYPNTFELKIYDPSFPEEYARTGTFAPDVIPGILLTLKPEPSVAAYESELQDKEGVIVGINVATVRNLYLTGRSFLFQRTDQGYVPVDLAWAEEDRMKPGNQGQVLNTEAMETDALYLYYHEDWKRVEFMAALSPTREPGTGSSGPCPQGAIAYDVTTASTQFGDVRIEECVTRDGNVDTYTYTVTNVSFANEGSGIRYFRLPNVHNLTTLDQQGPDGWLMNPTMPAGWEWLAPPGDPGILVGNSAVFSFSVPGPTMDCRANGGIGPGHQTTTLAAVVDTWVDIETTGPCMELADKLVVKGCPDLVIKVNWATCACKVVHASCTCTLTVVATISNIGTETAMLFDSRMNGYWGSYDIGSDTVWTGTLAPGASVLVSFEIVFPCLDIVGCPHFDVVVDIEDSVRECSEDNNTDTGSACCR